jgi:hypothetical protein
VSRSWHGIGIVAAGLGKNPALLCKAPIQTGLRQGGQQADHGGDDPGSLNELELPREDVV